MVIAIDGPAGAGKSTVALAALRAGIDLDDPARVGKLAREIEIGLADGGVTLNGEDVTDAIRTPEVSAAASRVSVHPEVRDAMVAQQRGLIEAGDYVAEGRDIGTVVSPDAPLKVFLTASDEERARRRAAETGAAVDDVLAAQRARDARDRGREHGALRAAPDAVEIDTTGLDVEQVVGRVVELARERGLVAA
jgi:cytidylate kinase